MKRIYVLLPKLIIIILIYYITKVIVAIKIIINNLSSKAILVQNKNEK